MKSQQLCEGGDHVPALDDGIAEAVLEEELGSLEASGELLPGGLLDHARASESHERARLGERDVALHGEARRDATRCGVRQDAHVEKPRLGMTF